MIEGIRYLHLTSRYPRLIPWSEVRGIGIYELIETPQYALFIECKHGDDIEVLKTRDLAAAEAAFEAIMTQVAEGAAIVEVPA